MTIDNYFRSLHYKIIIPINNKVELVVEPIVEQIVELTVEPRFKPIVELMVESRFKP